jgi:hypothetical protein
LEKLFLAGKMATKSPKKWHQNLGKQDFYPPKAKKT